jgi:hypothetical protein
VVSWADNTDARERRSALSAGRARTGLPCLRRAPAWQARGAGYGYDKPIVAGEHGGPVLFEFPELDDVIGHDAANALFAEFAVHLPPDGGIGRPFAEAASLRSAGFADVRERALTVGIPLADGETLWRWLQRHVEVSR